MDLGTSSSTSTNNTRNVSSNRQQQQKEGSLLERRCTIGTCGLSSSLSIGYPPPDHNTHSTPHLGGGDGSHEAEQGAHAQRHAEHEQQVGEEHAWGVAGREGDSNRPECERLECHLTQQGRGFTAWEASSEKAALTLCSHSHIHTKHMTPQSRPPAHLLCGCIPP